MQIIAVLGISKYHDWTGVSTVFGNLSTYLCIVLYNSYLKNKCQSKLTIVSLC